MEMKVIQSEFVQGKQDYRLTIVGKAGKYTLRLKLKRDAYDFQSSFASELWVKQIGGLDAGWKEVLRYSGEASKNLASPYAADQKLLEDELRNVAFALASDTLQTVGLSDALAHMAADTLAWGRPGED